MSIVQHETIDSEEWPPLPPPLVFETHAGDCPAKSAARAFPGHPVNAVLCQCGALEKPGPVELDCRIVVRDAADVDLKSITWGSEPRLELAVIDSVGETQLTLKAARALASKLLAWADSRKDQG